MMNSYRRAIRYVLRQKSKSLLLGSVLFLTILVCLSSVSILRVTNEMIAALAKNSNANVGMFALDVTNAISLYDIQRLQELDNVRDVNKTSQLEAIINDYVYVGGPESVFGVEFSLNGNDDFTLEGPFFLQSKHLVEGSLNLQDNEIIIFDALAELNDWSIGDVIPFATEDGNIGEGVVAGIYRLSERTARLDSTVIYTTTALIDELQGYYGYSSAAFYVTNPEEIQQTKEEMTTLIANSDYDWSISDFLYRQMRAPLDGTRGLVQVMLAVTVVVSIMIVSLLLSLWIRERRKEAALLLAVGEAKSLIVGQRLLEVFVIFITIFFLLTFLLVVMMPYIGDIFYRVQEIEIYEDSLIENPEFYLTFIDVIITLGIGSATLFVSTIISFIPLIKSTPRHILTTID